MWKLPVCPYCHTVYSYQEIVSMKGKEHQCYHCGRSFLIRRSLRAVPVIAVCMILILFNMIIFDASKDINIGVVAVMNLIAVAASLAASPLMIRFRKKQETKEAKNDQPKKDRKR